MAINYFTAESLAQRLSQTIDTQFRIHLQYHLRKQAETVINESIDDIMNHLKGKIYATEDFGEGLKIALIVDGVKQPDAEA